MQTSFNTIFSLISKYVNDLNIKLTYTKTDEDGNETAHNYTKNNKDIEPLKVSIQNLQFIQNRIGLKVSLQDKPECISSDEKDGFLSSTDIEKQEKLNDNFEILVNEHIVN